MVLTFRERGQRKPKHPAFAQQAGQMKGGMAAFDVRSNINVCPLPLLLYLTQSELRNSPLAAVVQKEEGGYSCN